MKNYVKATAWLMAGCSLFAISTVANAQDANKSDNAKEEVVVVTGVAKGQNRLDTSISISSLGNAEIAKAAPRSAAEIFRNIPGFRSESTGGEGNANIAVRGLPVAAGGAKFLQIQEDGLPILEFGDIAFGNADIFLRTDLSVGRIEAVRGGTASTLASNSPGGILNIISKDGSAEGGAVQITQGLDFDQSRVEFDYGGALSDNTNFHIGGFYRKGEGPRKAGYDANNGGQFEGNLTRHFDKGFVRVGFKYLNDRTIGYLPMPMAVSGTNADPKWGSVPGLDAQSDTIHSAYFLSDAGLGSNNQNHVSDVRDGMHPVVKAFNAEAKFDVGGGWNLDNKFRYSQNSGDFVSLFPESVGTASEIAAKLGGTSLTIANGPGAGSAYTGLAMRVHTFNVLLNNLDNMANDLKLSKTFNLDNSKLDVTFGLYNSHQNINMDWIWNSYLMEVKGDNARLLNAYNGTTLLTQNGLAAYGVPAWGNCCTRHYDTQYDIVAPYMVATYSIDKLSLEASIRHDGGKARGNYAGSVQKPNFDVNGDGIIQPTEVSVSVIDYANPQLVNYDWNYTSYSLGANYRLSDNVSLFARTSKGGRANADRLLFGKVKADGSVAKQDAVDFVKQHEAGVKYSQGGVKLYATAFFATTEEQNYEATTQRFIDRVYEAKGVEFEGAYRFGNFKINGGATYTNAEITKDALNPTQVGNTPRRQAKWVFQMTPSYKMDKLEFGANFIGTTKSYTSDDNLLVMPGYIQTNLFANYQFTEKLLVSLNVNNAFDTFGVTEAEEGSITANTTNYVRARAINGRTTTLSLKYSF